MKATPEDQLRLLDLQKVDAEIDLLNHRAKNLPEHSQITELEAVKQSSDSELGLVSIDEADVKREVAKADADAEQVRSRKTRDEVRLASGQGSAKDLEHLQHELVSLSRRVNDLEEIELEIMMRLDEFTSKANEYRVIIADTDAKLEVLTASRDKQLSELAVNVKNLKEERGTIAGKIAAEFLALYEKLRASNEGVGAAAIVRKRCSGCHLDLTAIDAEKFKQAPVDEVLRCEECRRILIRTVDSGLI
jgi:hypothetical protein